MPSTTTGGKLTLPAGSQLPRAVQPCGRHHEVPAIAENPVPKLRARYPWLDWLMSVNERVGAINGGALSSAIALAAFLSLFPLLVVGIAVVGFFSADDEDFASRTVEELGLTGDAADTVLDAIDAAERNRQATTVVGLAGLAWSGLAVLGAVETAVNAAWQVKGRGLRGKPRAAAWLLGLGLLMAVSTGATHLLSELPGPAIVPTVAASALVDIVLVLALFRMLTNVAVEWRAHLPGAIAGGLGLTVLQLISGAYVPRLIESSSLYGSIGVVLALLAWFLLIAKLVVYSAAINVVAYERRHGTVTAEVQVPKVDAVVVLETSRGGAVATTVSGADRSG